jgi:hypothetical protein
VLTAMQRVRIAHAVGIVVWIVNVFFGQKFGLTVDQFTLINCVAIVVMLYAWYEREWGVRREAKTAPTR